MAPKQAFSEDITEEGKKFSLRSMPQKDTKTSFESK